MKNFLPIALALSLGIGLLPELSFAQAQDDSAVQLGEVAQAFAAGSIQKTTPRDGIVNLITGDNQTTGDRMILGKADILYLKLYKSDDLAIGDLFTIYRRVRKVFHPMTREYMGMVTIRVAVAKVIQVDYNLATALIVRSYSAIAPGDPIVRFTAQPPAEEPMRTGEGGEINGMIVELPADRTATLVSQADVVYLDRGRQDGVRTGDQMEITRIRGGLPPRIIGRLKVLSTEDRTATARVAKAVTKILIGDRFKLAVASPPMNQPAERSPAPELLPTAPVKAEAPTLASSSLKMADSAGQTRINLGGQTNFLRYDSGEAAIKPEGYALLDQLIDYLHKSGDERLIRVEGHADNMEIGPSLRSRYPSNWELSKARASGVVRYLIEKGGIDSTRLSSVGYGDSKPLTANLKEEGRAKNRRVEVLLYAPSEEQGSAKPEMPEQAGEPAEPSSLSAKGAEGSASPAGATDVTPSSGAPTSGQEPGVPSGGDATGPLTAPDGKVSGTTTPDAPPTDVPAAAAVPDK